MTHLDLTKNNANSWTNQSEAAYANRYLLSSTDSDTTPTGKNVGKVVVNNYTTMYLAPNGELYVCGYNNYGQLGSGDTEDILELTKRAENVKDFQNDNAKCSYLTENAELYMSGYNGSGQQGSGDTTNVLEFTRRGTDVYSIANNAYNGSQKTSWYTSNSGLSYGTGLSNYYGAYNQGTIRSFAGHSLGLKSIAYKTNMSESYEQYVLYVDSVGTLRFFGNTSTSTSAGFWAVGSTARSSVAPSETLAYSVKDVFTSGQTSAYLDMQDNLYLVGGNTYGQQGNGTTTTVSRYRKVATDVQKVICTEYTTWILFKSGDLYGCGRNNYGQQGSGDTTDVLEFTKRAENVIDVAASNAHTSYINYKHELYRCGRNEFGQQGDGTTDNVTTFQKIADDVYYVNPSNSVTTFYITSNCELYGCGYNNHGQLGLGDTENRQRFVRIFPPVKTRTAQCVVMKNASGNYVLPMAYSTKYDMDGDTIDIEALQPVSTAVSRPSGVGVGSPSKPVYITSSGVATECDYSLPTEVSADLDMSNLTSLGLDNLVKCAHKLDWDNAIQVTQVASSDVRQYTCPDNGAFYVYVGVSTSGSSRTINAYVGSGPTSERFVGSWTTTTSYATGMHKYVQKGEIVNYVAYASGGANAHYAYFIPFKKD